MKTVEQIRKEYPDFKSPQELGITDQEYCAMNEVREGLCEGRYVHDPMQKLHHANGFNMAVGYNSSTIFGGCGTAACIGGWMSHAMNGGRYKNGYVSAGLGTLNALFYPPMHGAAPPWHTLTPTQAAQACANFMHGNTADPWKGV